MTETRHVRIEWDEARETKKEILSTQMNILNIFKRIQTYKQLRKKEVAIKNKLHMTLKSVKTRLKELQSYLPEDNMPHLKETTRMRKENIKKRQRFEDELAEIRRKLEKL